MGATVGSFVSWPDGEGQVDLVVTQGTVPGVAESLGGTEEAPVARVLLWEDGKPTGERVAVLVDHVTQIGPLGEAEEKADPMARLVAMHGRHEEHRLDAGLGEPVSLSGVAVKAAYDRGLVDWPGPSRTSLSPVDWAIGRAEHLCKAALGEAASTRDADLLHRDHALAPARPEERVLDAATVQADLDAILADAAE